MSCLPAIFLLTSAALCAFIVIGFTFVDILN
jgi:hypothetical protein